MDVNNWQMVSLHMNAREYEATYNVLSSVVRRASRRDSLKNDAEKMAYLRQALDADAMSEKIEEAIEDIVDEDAAKAAKRLDQLALTPANKEKLRHILTTSSS